MVKEEQLMTAQHTVVPKHVAIDRAMERFLVGIWIRARA